MDFPFVKKHILILASVFFLLLSGLNYLFFEKDSPGISSERYVSKVQKQLNTEIKDSKFELDELGINYQNAPDSLFINFEKTTKYPYYIYRNGHLLYWSDNHFVPDYQTLKQNKQQISLLNTLHGKFIVNTLAFTHQGSRIELFSLINLFQQFKNENDYLRTGFNSRIFSKEPQSIILTSPSQDKNAYRNIFDTQGQFLFSVIPPIVDISTEITGRTLFFLAISLILLVIYGIKKIAFFYANKQIGYAFLFFIGLLLLLRGFMLRYNIPSNFIDSELFNPKYYAGGVLAPSFGDLLINAFLIFIVLFLLTTYFRISHFYRNLRGLSKQSKNIYSVLFVLLSLLVNYFCYQSLNNVYEKSQYMLDLSLGITFTPLKIATMAYYILLSSIYFLFLHLLSSLFIRLNPKFSIALARWAYGLILGLILFVFIDTFRWIYLLTGVYFLLLYWARFPRYLYSFRYRTSIYLFVGALIFALITIDVIYKQEQRKDVLAKQKYGQKFLAENDLLGEGLLQKVVQSVERDSSIQNALSNTLLAREKVQQLIKNKHLGLYFDRYDTEILAFDNAGNSLDNTPNSKNLAYYDTQYKLSKYKTQSPFIFLVNDMANDFINQYFVFITVPENGSKAGSIVMNLRLRDEFSNSFYPELLMDKKFVQDPETRNYSYAILGAINQMVYSAGSYNYERKLPINILANSNLYTKGIALNNYRHVGVMGLHDRKIIISSREYLYRTLFSNFSFLFLISIIGIILVMMCYILKYGFMNMNVNYATKIQIYLNAAFLVPLLLVVIITLSAINNAFVNTQDKTYLDNAKNIASTLQIYLESYKNKHISLPFLEQELSNLARDTKVDINFYDPTGRLSLSSRPLIFASGLQSNFVNPIAYRRIIEERENEAILPEKLGDLKYKCVYLGIKANNGQSLGLMSIPFFDSKIVLNYHIMDVVVSILSIFSFVFVLLLIISYFASNILTYPLRLVTQKIRRTNLDKLNEPLVWKSDDEIGLLMGEYNKMLGKLQESKIALSQSEKQSAWREMAKQVAHEIKNPLTPMKLSIQQLQRTLPTDNPKAKERIERTLDSLTEQIDTISDIANSFSEFAKMPVPRNEVFDLMPVIQKTIDLHNDQDNLFINFDIKDKDTFVLGDRQFMSRVITNLILNGIQSVVNKKPIINLKLYRNTEDNFAVLEIQDNGVGIPENYRKKVFMPNFSTKVSGSGLGLAMARRGIEHAGGNIWFETEEGVGTTFFIELPLAAV